MIQAVAGYFTPIDGFQHAIAATDDGRLYETYFNPQKGIFRDVLGNFESITSIAGYFTPIDGFQHVIVATGDGDVHEVYFNPQKGIFEDTLAHFDGIIDIAGFFTPDDNFQHVIVATSDGNLHEVYFNPQKGIFQDIFAHFDGIIAIDGFFTPDDNYRHAIVATNDGNLHEVYFNPQKGIFQDVFAHFDGVIDVAGFFTPDDNYRHAIVATSDGNLHEVYFNPQKGIFQDILVHLAGIGRIGAYFTPTDGNRHVIVATSDGNLHEVYFNPRRGIFQDVLTTLFDVPPTLEDNSPNAANGVPGLPRSTSGVIIGLAGDRPALYALSLNAGVWKSTAGGRWTQLSHSPGNGCCLAIDPNNSSHLVVGERDGDALPLSLNQSGVWESFDGGNSWTYILNPLSLPHYTSQAVPAIAFSPTSTLFAATTRGIGRKAAGTSSFDFSHSPAVAMFTAFATGGSTVWARTSSTLFASPNDGLTWTSRPIPATITIPQTVVGSTIVPAGTYTIVTDTMVAGGNDFLSLATFDSLAFLPVRLLDATGGSPAANHNILLIHDFNANTWRVQIFESGSGLGLGGRRFAKSCMLNRPDLPPTLGGRSQLIFCGADDVSKAQGIGGDGTIQWDNDFAHTFASGASPQSMHSDIWDVHLAPDGATAWVACDGGVYQRSLPLGQWITLNDALHTHHAHTITILPVNDVTRSRLAYPTTDNDGWFRDVRGDWQHVNTLGDANWSAGDAGNPALALIVRQPELAVMTAFGETPPAGANVHEGQAIVLNNGSGFDGPLFLQFIQTLKDESPTYPLLDAVMLVNLPLRDANGTPVPGLLGQPNPAGNPVLIRTQTFAANPDANASKFQNWQIEANNLPAGTRGFWASGGHALPTYYLYAEQQGALTLYKRAGTGWQALNVSGLLDGGTYGPAFINPFHPLHLYVLTRTGTKVSFNGGNSFQDETALTRLVTDSGKYPLVGNFNSDPKFIAVGNRSHATSMGTLSHMAFQRNNPDKVVAASPFTGAFYTNGDGHWRTLTPFLPSPLSPVASVGIDNEAVYVALEGRSVVRILGYRSTPLVS